MARFALIFPLTLITASLATAAPRVDLEVVTGEGFPLGGEQTWMKTLAEAGADSLRIRGGRAGDAADIVVGGTESSPRYKLIGILTSDKLVLRGGTFGRGDMRKLRAYLDTIRADGPGGVTERKEAFGLTGKQLIEAMKDLTPPIRMATKGKPPADAVAQIADELGLRVVVDSQAARALAGGEACRDELTGVSAGSGLAALLRPYGLVLQPHRPPGGEIIHTIVPARPDSQPWPIGWPPEQKTREMLPVFFEFIDVEIDGVMLDEAVAALAGDIKAPILYDHNSLALHRIDPAKIEVSMPAGRTYYKKILDRLLFQARLKAEVRTDEAGHPLIWVTSIK